MSFVNENRLDKLSPFANNFAEDDGLFEEEDLEFFKLFGRQFAQFGAAI